MIIIGDKTNIIDYLWDPFVLVWEKNNQKETYDVCCHENSAGYNTSQYGFIE